MQEKRMNEIEALYLKQYNMMLTYALRILKNKALAEEAVQEAFRIACQRAKVFLESENKEGWLLNTLKYVILNIRRKQFRAISNMSEYVTLVERFRLEENDIALDVLYKDIASMDEFILVKGLVLEKKSIQELADERGISVDACKKRVQRAKQTLRKRLEEVENL